MMTLKDVLKPLKQDQNAHRLQHLKDNVTN